jgi:hypothetical protein
MKKPNRGLRKNLRLAKFIWPNLSEHAVRQLKNLVIGHELEVADGDLQLLQGRWYVTHTGLLHLAKRRRCVSIETVLVENVSDPRAQRWIFKATVHPSRCRSFVGFGDAEPSNISASMQGAELRIAETRAVNRALRKAYGIGVCSVEELQGVEPPAPHTFARSERANQDGSSNGQPKLRDRLCLLIREHSLNAALVKSYAADFCGTVNLAAASRDSVESFISHLSSAAKENRDGLICKLNSYAQPVEANP